MSYLNQVYNTCHTITGLYEQLRCQNTIEKDGFYYPDNPFVKDPNIALGLTVSISGENYGFEKDGNTQHSEWQSRVDKCIHILITSRHNVFVKVCDLNDGSTPQFTIKEDKLDGWVNTSNHDSCWRTDGIQSLLVDIAANATEHCTNSTPVEHRRICDIDVDLVGLNLGSLFNLYRITHEMDDQSKSGHGRKLTSIKKLKTVISFEEE